MKQIADLHIHSRFSRACSRDLTLTNIDRICRVKGVDIIATGDFTYPEWFKEIKDELEEIITPPQSSPSQGEEGRTSPSPYEGEGWGEVRGKGGGSGLYKLKVADNDKVKFILSTEVALIYKHNDKVRRLHIVLHAPNLESAEELNKYLDKNFNIRSDGRPILGMNAQALVKLCLSINPRFLIYPAHIWTPWFAVFGSKSGYDSMEECFGEYTKNIYAYETGLSSDPEMNWRLKALDKLTLLSNSDAHSLPNIGREANIFDLEDFSYSEIYAAIKNKDKNKIKGTIEFYPEEGMYHYDGHRDCKICFTPEETRRHKGICPVCKKPLVVGVMNRVMELADRPTGFRPKEASDFIKLVELDKIIAESMNIKSRQSAKVKQEYDNLIKKLGNELNILNNIDIKEIKKISNPMIAEGIKRVRQGKLIIEPGYDGLYGKVKIFSDEEKKGKQKKLF
jgi:uncharacterized protein (TIGR00375 family)